MLHLTISFARGGRRDAIVTLAEGLSKAGVMSHLMTLRGDPAEMEPFRGAFAETGMLGVEGLPWPGQVLALRRYCRDHAIDILHAHDASSQFVVSALRTVAPSLHGAMTFHRSLSYESSGMRNKARNAASLTMINRVFTASNERREHFLLENWYPSQRVEVVPLGIDTTRFAPNPAVRDTLRSELGVQPGTPVLISMGHYGPEKGIDRVIEIFGEFSARWQGPTPHLVVLGTGDPDRVELLQGMAREVSRGSVWFLGQRSDPERWLNAADAMVHLPGVEAFGLAVVQGMATGLPVVAAHIGGIPDLIADDVTGFLVDREDAAAISQRLHLLLSDEQQRLAIGRAARDRAVDFYTTDAFTARQLAAYRRMMA